MLVEQRDVAQIHIEREGQLRVGRIFDARLVRKLNVRRGLVSGDGVEAMLDPLPAGMTEGHTVRVELVREGIAERGRFKLPRVRAALADARSGEGPDLESRIMASGLPVVRTGAHGEDMLASHGWHEQIEAAASGHVPFAGGALEIGLTAGMTVIDVDGELEPRQLAFAAAAEAARAIRRFGLAGSIGIDFPTLADKQDRTRIAESFDAAMFLPCERTAVNGFGFMQVVLRRTRASLPELLAGDRVLAATLSVLRRAERTGGTGALQLQVHPAVAARLANRPQWIDSLERAAGRVVTIHADASIAMDHGQVHAEGQRG